MKPYSVIPKPLEKLNRNTRAAREIRDLLFSKMGYCCAVCGATEKLSFDVKTPGDPYSHHGLMSYRQRMGFYRREFEKNNLQILCSRHNSIKKNRTMREFESSLSDEELQILRA